MCWSIMCVCNRECTNMKRSQVFSTLRPDWRFSTGLGQSAISPFFKTRNFSGRKTRTAEQKTGKWKYVSRMKGEKKRESAHLGALKWIKVIRLCDISVSLLWMLNHREIYLKQVPNHLALNRHNIYLRCFFSSVKRWAGALQRSGEQRVALHS